ncbi:MAG: M23 family metallopeptidase, partial [Leptospira sp.]|nr:M23 family metallopeptidase [Leptospira sp.]
GDVVKKGDRIGEIGNSGMSDAPNLHFGIYSSDFKSIFFKFEKVKVILKDQSVVTDEPYKQGSIVEN